MLVLTAWILASSLALPTPGVQTPIRIGVDCRVPRALERALIRAKSVNEADIVLHGVCKGNFVIDTGNVTLRGATRQSGLAAPDPDTRRVPVLEVIDATVELRGLVVRGGEAGVLARGWDAEVLLVGVEVQGRADGVGVFASRGAVIRLIDSTVRDGNVGILADSNATLNLQNVVVSDQRLGVVVSGGSFAALNNSTIANNRECGLNVDFRSDVGVNGGAFSENGQVHINANDGSGVNLLSDVTIGSDVDTTPYALGVARSARIGSFSAPNIFGSVYAINDGSMRLGNTVIHGDLIVWEFADAYVRDAAITGSVSCVDGAEAICSRTTTAGAFGCPSPTCGTAAPGLQRLPPAIPKLPVIEAPRLERSLRSHPPN